MSKKNLGLGLIGAGRIGTFHAETIVERLFEADLMGIADPAPGAAAKLAAALDVDFHTTDVDALIQDPRIEALVMAVSDVFLGLTMIFASLVVMALFLRKPPKPAAGGGGGGGH